MNCINCSKRSWKNSWRSSVQELFECFYFCWNKMVIFGPFGTIEPLCTSSNQNNTKMVLFHWTNYFILSLIDFLKSRFGSRESHFSDENVLLAFLRVWNPVPVVNLMERLFKLYFCRSKRFEFPFLREKIFNDLARVRRMYIKEWNFWNTNNETKIFFTTIFFRWWFGIDEVFLHEFCSNIISQFFVLEKKL